MLPQPYKIDIDQGNVIEPAKVRQIKVGMSREDLIFLMGHPAISDHFHPNRYDYMHDLVKGNGEHTRQHLIIYFEGDHVSRIVKEKAPL